jgi:tRNA(Ile)-lysidine synthase
VVDAAVSAWLQQVGPDLPLVVGVSGGRDSVALATALAAQVPSGWLHQAHVHHGLRGQSADRDARLVECLAPTWQADLTAVRVDVPEYRRRHRLSTLEAARFLRYRALADLAERLGVGRVIVAHTRDDRIETLLLNLLRGGGTRALVGMRARSRLPRRALGPEPLRDLTATWDSVLVERPLLDVARADTGSYCAARGLPYRDDPSNCDRRYRRAWVRHELLPHLRAALPHYEPMLLRLACSADETMRELDRVLDQQWPSLTDERDAVLRVRLEAVHRLPSALGPHVLARAVSSLEHAGELGSVHLLALRRLADAREGAGIDLPGGVRARKEHGALVFTRGEVRSSPSLGVATQVRLPVPGAITLPDHRRLVASLATPPGRIRFEPDAAWLTEHAGGDLLTVRARRTGDRFKPLGAPGSKLLKDAFIDRKVPRGQRELVPVVVGRDGILWVPGLPVADAARVEPAATRALRLEILPPLSGGE